MMTAQGDAINANRATPIDSDQIAAGEAPSIMLATRPSGSAEFLLGGSAEFRLAVACARHPASSVRVVAAAHESIDWALFVRVARRHGIASLAVDALLQADVAVPEALERMARRRGRAALRQAGEALRLQDLLAAAGVAALFLKGPSLAQRAFGTIGARDAVDIDVAVAPHAVAAAWSVLSAAGYRAESPGRRLSGAALRTFLAVAKDSFHRHATSGAIVELHWRLSDDLVDPAIPDPATWRGVEVALGRALATLGDDTLFTYLCVHGAAHGWARLKWLADIGALLIDSDDGGVRYWRAAQTAGADRAVASALVLADRLLAIDLPPGFVAPHSWRLRALLALSSRTMMAGGGARELASTPYRGWVEFAAKLLIAPTLRSLAPTLRRLAISSEDVGTLALPAGCIWLYPLLRVPMLVVRRQRRARLRLSAIRTRSAAS